MAAALALALAGSAATGFGAASAAGAFGTARAQAATTAQAPATADWPQPGGDFGSTRFSPLQQVNTADASKLQVAWEMSTGTDRGLEGQPLVIGDTMFTVSAYPNYVTAINLNNDQPEWKYVPPEQLAQPIADNPAAVNTACCDLVNRGPAYDNGKLFFLTLDGHVTALDAKTGAVLWNVQNADPKISQTGTAAPLVIHGKVIVGMSGDEYGVRGYLTAYDENTGKQLWRAFNVGPDKDLLLSPQFIKRFGANSSLNTWQGTQWQQGGGSPWAWMSYDPSLNLVYNTTGNPAPWNPTQRPGDNKWAESVTARNPDNGQLIWAYQFNEHDNWDYDSTQEMIFFDAHVNGQTIPAMAHFDKNGFSYVLSRATGELLAAHSYYVNNNVVTGVDMKTGRTLYNPDKLTPQGKVVDNICPFAQGAKDDQPAAYDPQDGLFYIPTNNGCMQWQSMHVDFQGGQNTYVGAIVRFFRGPGGYGGAFEAFDPMTGKISFMDKEAWPVWSGVLTTAGGVAFYGTLDGFFKAVDEKTGKVLFSFHMPSGVIGAPIAYTTPSGQEQVAVYAGLGGWPGEYIANNETNPTDELGAVNWYRFGRCTATDDPCQTPLQDEVNLGGDLVVFDVPGGNAAVSGAAGAVGVGGAAIGPLVAGPVLLAGALALGVADLRRLRIAVGPFRIQHA
ncbi:MAG: PQQ-dependent dehydrogenase, methanol/ethanol family [Streptosporangiaceae bacterium]|nr:PQQ-dependent dehydrogenase, methanol/ethanol family [Streptosporangiaceae bacterium]